MSRCIAMAIAVALYGVAHHAHAHDWYPAACCQGLDCAPVKQRGIALTPEGWRILKSGELIPFFDERIRLSPDRDFHRCLTDFWEPEGGTRCLFVPRPDS